MTVTGVTTPSAPNTCVIPTFLPMIPVTISHLNVVSVPDTPDAGYVRLLAVLLAERLDLDVDASRQIQLHQRVHRLRGRLEDVDQPLVRADLELLARLLVDVRRPQHRPLVLLGGERHRPGQARPRPLRGLDDLARGLIQDAIVVGLQADANLVAECCGHVLFSLKPAVATLTG